MWAESPKIRAILEALEKQYQEAGGRAEGAGAVSATAHYDADGKVINVKIQANFTVPV